MSAAIILAALAAVEYGAMEMRTQICQPFPGSLSIIGAGYAVSVLAHRGRVSAIAVHDHIQTYPCYPSDQVFAQAYGEVEAILRVMGEKDLAALAKETEVATCR